MHSCYLTVFARSLICVLECQDVPGIEDIPVLHITVPLCALYHLYRIGLKAQNVGACDHNTAIISTRIDDSYTSSRLREDARPATLLALVSLEVVPVHARPRNSLH